MHCLKFTASALLFIVFALTGKAQEDVSLENFSRLRASGLIPEDFQRSWADKFEETLERGQASHENKRSAKIFEEFWQKQYRHVDEMLQSGRFSFGDPLSIYLNNIADTLLRDQPALRKKVRIYLFKSPTVNAFCMADGVIGIHTGLFAHARSEAELAYILAHEISHYTQHHVYDEYKQIKALNDHGWFSSSVNPIKKFDALISRSQEYELDADKHGIDLYLRSPYHPAAVDSGFTTLHQSYITYGRTEVGTDFLGDRNFTLPDVFYRPQIDPVSKEEDYFDRTHTHPNISTRRKAVAAVLEKAEAGDKKFFLQPEVAFYQLRDLARFEALREKVLYGVYGEALYDIYVLERKYPENKFLELAKVRTLFGLAGFKAVNRISEVTGASSHIEGPSQQVFHLIKQLNNQQLVSLALYHTLRAREKYPQEKMLDNYIISLNRYLVAYCELKPGDFATDTNEIAAFNKSAEDYSSERHFLRAKQMHYRDFYRYLFVKEYKSGWLKEKMEEHRSFKDSLDREDYLTVDEREKRAEQQAEKLEQYGSGLNIREMIILDPSIYVVNASEDIEKQLEGLRKEESYKVLLPKWIKEAGINPVPLYMEEMESSMDYNQFSALEEWIAEARMFRAYNVVPTGLDISEEISGSTRYVCRIYGYIDDEGKDFYYFGIYDLKKGEVVYERREKAGRNLSMDDLEKETKLDLKRIYN